MVRGSKAALPPTVVPPDSRDYCRRGCGHSEAFFQGQLRLLRRYSSLPEQGAEQEEQKDKAKNKVADEQNVNMLLVLVFSCTCTNRMKLNAEQFLNKCLKLEITLELN